MNLPPELVLHRSAALAVLATSVGAGQARAPGKAIIVVPMTSLAPVITIVLSLILHSVIPGPMLVAGMIITCGAIYFMAE